VLKEIDETNRDEVYRLMQCLVVSIRPLIVEELAEILAVDFDDAEGIPKLNPDWRWEDQERGLQAACSSLISIVDTGRSRVVQFSHFSVKEFLTSPRLASSSGDVSQYHVSLEPAHTVLAQACLGVLLRLDDSGAKIGSDEDRPIVVTARRSELHAQQVVAAGFPLAKYAAQYWVKHAQFENVSSCVQKGMERLFDPDKPQFLAWLKLYDIDRDIPRDLTFVLQLMFISPRRQMDGTPLYYASLCGFHDLAERLTFKHPHHVNARGGYCGTPLLAALAKNRFQVAQLLCQHGADVCLRNEDRTTPLHYPSAAGYPELVQLLLSYGADANASGLLGRTPLHWAAENGHLDVVRILLEHKAGRTPLRDPSQFGRLGMVRVLPGHGVDVNARDAINSTPLHLTSRRGRLEVARVLLEHGADVEAETNGGRTAFQLASENGHGEIMELLSDHCARHEGKS
jgi:Ankyrin repeats (3 copies)